MLLGSTPPTLNCSKREHAEDIFRLLFQCLTDSGFQFVLVESSADEELLALAFRQGEDLPTVGGGHRHMGPDRSLSIANFADNTGDYRTDLAVLFEKALEKGAHTGDDTVFDLEPAFCGTQLQFSFFPSFARDPTRSSRSF